MIDFANVKQWWIDQYEVIKAQLNGVDVWEKAVVNPFYLTNDDVSPVTVSIKKYASVTGDANDAPTVSLEVSDDGNTWSTLGNTSTTALSFTIPVGGRKYLRSTSANAWSTGLCSNQFSSTGQFGAHGSIMALLGYDTLKGHDCAYMFHDCTSLTTAPALPATTLTSHCYTGMFFGCTGLTTAPALPATTLAGWCYADMFRGCTLLTSAPALPATTLADWCYAGMFSNCSNLTYIKCLATNISATSCTSNWVNGVAASGTFVKDVNMSSWTTGVNGIPSGWTVVQNGLFYLTNDDSAPVTVSITKASGIVGRDASLAPTISLETSDDGTTWTTLGNTSTTALNLTIPVGGRKYLRSTSANAWSLNDGTSYYNYFSSDGYFGAHGSIMALLGYDTLKGYDCESMFHVCHKLTTAPELPATTLANDCYAYMFDRCTSLTIAPTLPATILAEACYLDMFYGCTGLTTAPALPATTLVSSCYYSMFRDCTSLTTAPALPATTLAGSCYYSMFRDCTSLTTAPVLPATTLAPGCYSNMFNGCTSLSDITCYTTDTKATNYATNWVKNVAASGVFHKNASMSSWTTGADGIPSGWTVQDIQ